MNYDVIMVVYMNVSKREEKKTGIEMISTYCVESENGNFMRVSQMNWAIFMPMVFNAPKAIFRFGFSLFYTLNFYIVHLHMYT